MSLSHYLLSDTKIWFDFSCVMKVKHVIFEWLWDSTEGSTLHFVKSIQVSFMLFLILQKTLFLRYTFVSVDTIK